MNTTPFIAMIMVGVGIVFMGVGVMNQEKSKSQELGSVPMWVQSVGEYYEIHEWRNIFEDTFTFGRWAVFQTATDDKGLIDLTSLLTIKSRQEWCRASEISRVGNDEGIARCWDGILQIGNSPEGKEVLNYLESDNNNLGIGDSIIWETLIAEDAVYRGKIAWLQGYVLNTDSLPTHIIWAMYTQDGINFSIKKLTETWISTIFVKSIWDITIGADISKTLWFWSTDTSWAVFFESDARVIPTDFILEDDMTVFAWVVTKAVWAGIDNIEINKSN